MLPSAWVASDRSQVLALPTAATCATFGRGRGRVFELDLQQLPANLLFLGVRSAMRLVPRQRVPPIDFGFGPAGPFPVPTREMVITKFAMQACQGSA